MSTSNSSDSMFIYHRKNICCCGRYILSNGEPLVQNNIIHQELGPEGNFCGSYDHFVISNLENKVKKFISKLTEIKSSIESDFMLNGEWIENPSNLIKSIHEDCEELIK